MASPQGKALGYPSGVPLDDVEFALDAARRPTPSSSQAPYHHHMEIGIVPEEVKQFRRFEKGAVCLKPIAGWSEDEWAYALSRNPASSPALMVALNINKTVSIDNRQTAQTIVQMMRKGLLETQWRKIVQFQHCDDMDVHELDADAIKYYPDPSITVNSLFDREFPMGVDERHLDTIARWKFAVKHSGIQSSYHKKSRIVDFLVWGCLFGLTLAMVVFLVYFANKSGLWCLACTDQSGIDPKEVVSRTQDRGTVASILAALTFSLVGIKSYNTENHVYMGEYLSHHI